MSQQLIRYRESLNSEELAFLQKKEAAERSQFLKVLRIFMILSFALPFVIAWFRAVDGAENPFSYMHYFAGVFCLLSLSGLGIFMAYRRNLHKVQIDIHRKTKTIEQTHILRKQFMPHNQTYHFYIDSPEKMSIEVSADDYHRLDTGDELNIEYTTCAKLYLGYF